MNSRCIALAVAACCTFPGLAQASFHLMQIEQAMGGVNGDPTQQAVQLRMRASGQSQVSGGRIVAYDAAGANPVILITFPGNVGSSGSGARILVGSPNFATSPAIAPDFEMTASIPAAYLAAGRVAFEKNGTTYYSLCWGGVGYTGSNSGSTLNDDDGDFGACVAGPLPSASRQALVFNGPETTQGTTNAADFVLTADPATFTSNGGFLGFVSDTLVFIDGFED